MSYRSDKYLSLTGEDFSSKSTADFKKLFRESLENGIHGLCFSSYVEGQSPGSIISEEEIRQRKSRVSIFPALTKHGRLKKKEMWEPSE